MTRKMFLLRVWVFSKFLKKIEPKYSPTWAKNDFLGTISQFLSYNSRIVASKNLKMLQIGKH